MILDYKSLWNSEPRFGARHFSQKPDLSRPSATTNTTSPLPVYMFKKTFNGISIHKASGLALVKLRSLRRGRSERCEEVMHRTLAAVNLPPRVG